MKTTVMESTHLGVWSGLAKLPVLAAGFGTHLGDDGIAADLSPWMTVRSELGEENRTYKGSFGHRRVV